MPDLVPTISTNYLYPLSSSTHLLFFWESRLLSLDFARSGHHCHRRQWVTLCIAPDRDTSRSWVHSDMSKTLGLSRDEWGQSSRNAHYRICQCRLLQFLVAWRDYREKFLKNKKIPTFRKGFLSKYVIFLLLHKPGHVIEKTIKKKKKNFLECWL